jgi:hypothetical protein
VEVTHRPCAPWITCPVSLAKTFLEYAQLAGLVREAVKSRSATDRPESKPLVSRVRMNALQIFPETAASEAGGGGSRMIGPVRDSPDDLLASGA